MKLGARGVVVMAVLATAGLARAAPPPNEDCRAATIVTAPARLEVTTREALHAQAATPCAVADAYALWFRFTAPADNEADESYTFVVDGGDLVDTTLALYAACGDAEPLACSDDLAHALTSRLDVWLAPGQEVLVRVAGWGGLRGATVLRVDTTAAIDRPPNDACADAVTITQGFPGPAATYRATGTDQSSCGPEDAVDVWYRFVAPSAGTYDFTITKNSIAAHYIAVFESCAAGAAELGCGFLGTHATLAAGQEVVLRIGTNPSAADWFNVGVGPAPPAAVPTNDTPAGAIPVAVPSTTVASTRGATDDGLNWGPDCGPHVNAAIWYAFEAPSDDVYVFDTSGSGLDDTVVAIFDDCDVPALPGTVPALFACNQDDGVGHAARLDGFIEAGTRLCVAVAGHFLSEAGDVRLTVARLADPPVNDACPDALPIALGETIHADNVAAVPVDMTVACPWGNFPLWYTFTAPADGLYKFDTKDGVDAWPDIALYADCAAVTPLACSVEAQPAVHRDMARGERVHVRVSTDVWWRGTIPLRVGPVREADPDPDPNDEDPVEVVEAEPVAEAEPIVEADPIVEEAAVEDAPDVTEEPAAAEAEADAEPTHAGREDGGCGCAGGDAGAGGLAGALVLLGLRRRRHCAGAPARAQGGRGPAPRLGRHAGLPERTLDRSRRRERARPDVPRARAHRRR